MSGRTVVIWVVLLGVLMIGLGVGLVYLGAVAQALPSGFGVLSNVSPMARMIILIAVLAVIAIGAWIALRRTREIS